MKHKISQIVLFLFITDFSLNANIFPFKINGKYGFMDDTFKIVKSAEYNSINSVFNNEFFIVSKKTDNGIENEILDEDGVSIYKSYGMIKHVWNDYFSVSNKNKEELICLHSEDKIYAYQFIPTDEPKIPCKKETYRIYIDQTGKELFPNLQFRRSYGFFENRSVNINPNWNYEIIDGNGNYIFGKELADAGQHYSEGFLYVREKNGTSGYVDYNGNFKIKIPLMKKSEDNVIATNFYKKRAIVNTVNNKICLIDNNGQILKEGMKFYWFFDFCEDYSVVIYDDKSYNFMSLDGQFLSKETFDYAENFINGYACVIFKGQDALIDTNGNLYLMKDLVQRNY